MSDQDPLSEVDLFNRLGELGNLLIVDVRPAAAYQQGHVPRAVNVPLADLAESSGVAVGAVPLDEAVAKCSFCDRRTFKLNVKRRGASVVVYGESLEDASTQAFWDLLSKQKNITSLKALKGGYAAFAARYEFVCCKYTEAEVEEEKAIAEAGKMVFGKKGHSHASPFPWYPSEIIEKRIFLGNHVDAENLERLRQLGITHVLNVSDLPNFHDPHLQYLNFVLDDHHDTDISAVFKEAFEWLDKVLADEEHRVFVHCRQGISRSPTLLMGYLMTTNGWSLRETFQTVKGQRPIVNPNVGFWKQLGDYEYKLQGTSTIEECVDVGALQAELQAQESARKVKEEVKLNEEVDIRVKALEKSNAVLHRKLDDLANRLSKLDGSHMVTPIGRKITRGKLPLPRKKIIPLPVTRVSSARGTRPPAGVRPPAGGARGSTTRVTARVNTGLRPATAGARLKSPLTSPRDHEEKLKLPRVASMGSTSGRRPSTDSTASKSSTKPRPKKKKGGFGSTTDRFK